MVSLGKPGPQGWIPWGIWTEYIINNLFITHKGPYTEKEKASILGWAISGTILFAIPQLVAKVGLGTIGWVLGFYYSGKWLSQWIDPDEGLDNFHGFISGGNWSGSNEPDYYGGGSTMSFQNNPANRPGAGGYFDVVGNIARIGWAWQEEKKMTAELQKRTTAAEKRKISVELARSIKIGSFTSPEDLYKYGFIDVDDYLKRISERRVKTAEAKAAKRRWNKLTHSEQKIIVNTRRDLHLQSSILFAQMSW